MVNLGVQDLGDLKLWFAIYLDWRRWGLSPVQYGVGDGWFKLGDVEYRVNCTHRVWESEGEGE